MGGVKVIAEPGCTAEGDYATMVELLETAYRCGADIWKPQWTSDPARMCERRHIGPDHEKRAYYEQAYTWLAWPFAWHAEFRERCHKRGMQYACTVFLPEDIQIIARSVDYLKLSGFEHGDAAMRRLAIEVMTSEEIEYSSVRRAHVIVSEPGTERTTEYRVWLEHDCRVPIVLHCVSAYPAPLEAMQLLVLDTAYDGLSDHSRDTLTGAIATALGAQYIETHYRLRICRTNNPDYAVSFTPEELTIYIDNIRKAERMLGDGVKRVQACEHDMLQYRVHG